MIAPLLLGLAALLPQAGGDTTRDDRTESARISAEARAALAPVAEAMEDVEYLRGTFVQRQESLLLDEPIVSEGRILLRTEPATLVLELDGDAPTRIRSDRTTHTIHRPRTKRAERYVFERNIVADAMLACLGADAEALEKTFVARSVDVLPADPKTKTPERTRVVLAPRDERVARVVARLELTIDPKAKAVLSVRHENPDGERVTLELSKVELDPKEWKDPDAAFTDALPEGTDVRTRRVPAPKSKGSGDQP